MGDSDVPSSALMRDPPGSATHVRGSLLLSSVQALRAAGLFDLYAAHLTPAAEAAIFSFPASHWHSMLVALDHYTACEALNLTMAQQVDLGYQVSTRVQGTFVALLLRTARRLGVSPWTVLDNVEKIWDRVLTGGGGARVRRISDHSAHCKLAGLPIVDIPYLRNAWRGAFIAALEPFCTRVLVTEIIEARRPGVAVYGITWT